MYIYFRTERGQYLDTMLNIYVGLGPHVARLDTLLNYY